jgi:hypothetical protein
MLRRFPTASIGTAIRRRAIRLKVDLLALLGHFNEPRWLPSSMMASRRSRDCGAARLRRRVAYRRDRVALIGVLGGSPKPLNQPFNLELIDQGVGYALAGAALCTGSWALRRLLRRGCRNEETRNHRRAGQEGQERQQWFAVGFF